MTIHSPQARGLGQGKVLIFMKLGLLEVIKSSRNIMTVYSPPSTRLGTRDNAQRGGDILCACGVDWDLQGSVRFSHSATPRWPPRVMILRRCSTQSFWTRFPWRLSSHLKRVWLSVLFSFLRSFRLLLFWSLCLLFQSFAA
jgi:hypothetical protein